MLSLLSPKPVQQRNDDPGVAAERGSCSTIPDAPSAPAGWRGAGVSRNPCRDAPQTAAFCGCRLVHRDQFLADLNRDAHPPSTRGRCRPSRFTGLLLASWKLHMPPSSPPDVDQSAPRQLHSEQHLRSPDGAAVLGSRSQASGEDRQRVTAHSPRQGQAARRLPRV